MGYIIFVERNTTPILKRWPKGLFIIYSNLFYLNRGEPPKAVHFYFLCFYKLQVPVGCKPQKYNKIDCRGAVYFVQKGYWD